MSSGLPWRKVRRRCRRFCGEVKRLEHLGYEFEDGQTSVELLIRRVLSNPEPLWELLEYHCTYIRSVRNRYETCEATVKLRVGKENYYMVAEGDGPVNALGRSAAEGFKAGLPGDPKDHARRLQSQDYRFTCRHQSADAGIGRFDRPP